MKLKLARLIFVSVVSFFISSNVMAQQPAAKKTPVKKTVAKKPAQSAPGVTKTAIVTGVSNDSKEFPNGIKLNVKGFMVQDAYLVFEDETKVPADNKIDLSQRISLRIILTTGFKEVNGKVFPGGSEKITLGTGDKILESEDLFTAFDSTGVSPIDAKYITMKAVINEIKDKSIPVNIDVKVWDKKSAANEITGSYTIYIK